MKWPWSRAPVCLKRARTSDMEKWRVKKVEGLKGEEGTG
jgi:hypothetical protein